MYLWKVDRWEILLHLSHHLMLLNGLLLMLNTKENDQLSNHKKQTFSFFFHHYAFSSSTIIVYIAWLFGFNFLSDFASIQTKCIQVFTSFELEFPKLEYLLRSLSTNTCEYMKYPIFNFMSTGVSQWVCNLEISGRIAVGLQPLQWSWCCSNALQLQQCAARFLTKLHLQQRAAMVAFQLQLKQRTYSNMP